jgi:CBS domain-containing protein
MRDGDIGSVPIVENLNKKRLIGIVTDRDLVIRVLSEDQDHKIVRAQEVMTCDPATCSPDDDLAKCLDAMKSKQVRRMPIVDNSGRVVGIIAQADIALRMRQPARTGELIQEISQPRP